MHICSFHFFFLFAVQVKKLHGFFYRNEKHGETITVRAYITLFGSTSSIPMRQNLMLANKKLQACMEPHLKPLVKVQFNP